MVDSVFVLPPGERITDDSTGAPVSGGTLYFYDAGTTTPHPVYADSNLTTLLGTSVVTDALGYPTSDGSTRTLIYVGTANYKIVIKDASGNTVATHDNVKGAVVSASSANVSVTASFPVVSKSANYTVVSGDQNTTFAVNCSSADVTLTLPSAVTVGTGWKIKVQHAGSANNVLLVVAVGSGQTFSEGSKSFGGQYVLKLNGSDCEVSSDGGNWRISGRTPPFVKNAQGVIPIVSRLATSPVSPAAGDHYILTGTGGSWSAFATGDIALYTGAAWVNFTPYSNCGWRAWVQGESLAYIYSGSAWRSEAATDSVAGTQQNAVQTDMQTATSTTLSVVPGRVKYSPGVAKAWGFFVGNPISVTVSYNVSGIVRNSTGNYTVTLSTAMSSSNYVIVGMSSANQNDVISAVINSSSTFTLNEHSDTSNSQVDGTVFFVVYGTSS